MKMAGSLVAASVLAICASAPARAAVELGDHVTISGFGTLGVVRSSTDVAEFGRDRQLGGATTDLDLGVDSNAGLQVVGRFNDWLSVTVQGLLARRDSEEDLTLEPEWAFLKVQPLPGMTLRAGRMALPTFLISDSRNVGFANTWLRAPNEVYGLALLNQMDGADLSYSHDFGSVNVTATILAGDSSLRSLGQKFDANKVRGATLQLRSGPVTVRAGKVVSDVNVDVNVPGLNAPAEQYSFTSFGMTVDNGSYIAQAEYVQRRAELFYNLAAADAWYVMGGYRFGPFTPYAIYSSTKPQTSASRQPLQLMFPRVSNDQKTFAAGLRWDATSFAALKFQVERVDTDGTPGISFSSPDAPDSTLYFATPVGKPAKVLSLAVDFVF